MYSIFHTSHCGSSLLVALLSKSIEAYSEPSWTHEIYKQKNQLDYVKNNAKENCLIKYPSMYCNLMPLIDGKKIFLYRKLSSHLHKTQDVVGSDVAFSIMKQHFHQFTNNYNVSDDISATEKQTIMWASRMWHAIDSSNVMFVDFEDLIKHTDFTLHQICQFLNIEYIPVNIDFNVKIAGLHYVDTPINIDQATVKIKHIEPYIPLNFNLIKHAYNFCQGHPKFRFFA